jgi:hypothetical protein
VGGLAHSSGRDLARVAAGRGGILPMSPPTGQRILAALVLKPPRLRSSLTRTAPSCEAKRAEILELSRSPPRRWRLLCLAEKTHLQAVERLHPTLPLRPGLVERPECEDLRHGPLELFAAFEGGAGEIFAPCYQRHTHRGFRPFLRASAPAIPTAAGS